MNFGLLWLRLLLGAGSAYHGFSKIFGGHMDKFIHSVAKMGFAMPEVFAWMAALSEFLGGIMLILGFRTRVAAFFIFVTMSVAIFLHHTHDPLAQKELAIAYWAMAGALVLTGGGKYGLEGPSKKSS